MNWRVLIAVLSLFVAITTASPVRASLPASIDHVESTSYPIRVYYNEADKLTLANTLLQILDDLWQQQVVEMGFPSPYTVDDALQPVLGVRYYIVANLPGGVTQPIAVLADTPQTDCATITSMPDDLPTNYYPDFLEGGFNQVLTKTLDCTEGLFADKHSTMAAAIIGNRDNALFAQFLKEFQTTPHYSLNHVTMGGLYHYGSGLFSYFLDQHYGDGSGATLAQAWAAATQPGDVVIQGGSVSSTVENEPDFLDGVTTVLTQKGVTFDQAFATFATHRYFVGNNDDLQHMPGSTYWVGSEPAVEAYHYGDELPVSDMTPTAEPRIYGVNYLVFDLAGADQEAEFVFDFSGNEDVTWHVNTLALTGGTTGEQEMTLQDNHSGSITLPVADTNSVVVVVSNLGNGSYDQDTHYSVGYSYTYAAKLAKCSPIDVDGIDPGQIDAGSSQKFTIGGADFTDEEPYEVSFSGDGLAVDKVVRLSSREIEVTVEAADDAQPGTRDLQISLACGEQATVKDALLVVTGGCDCASTQPLQGPMALLALLALALRRKLRQR